jgi:hypothetical protein
MLSPKLVTRTTLGIRNLLFDEIDSLRAGTTTPQKAGAVSKMVTPIINSVKVEIEYQKHVSTKGFKNTPVLNLGSVPLPQRGEVAHVGATTGRRGRKPMTAAGNA